MQLDLDGYTGNIPNVSLVRYTQKRQKICETEVRASNYLEPEKKKDFFFKKIRKIYDKRHLELTLAVISFKKGQNTVQKLRKFTPILFCQKFSESNILNKEVTKKLI